MFKLKNIFYIGALMLATVSCDDYLDNPPADLMGTDGFYQTAAQSEQGIIGIYAGLRQLTNYEYLYMSECRSDNAWVNPTTDGARDYSEIGTFRATNGIATFNDAWNTWYKVIYDANMALSKIPNATFNDETVRLQFLNEAHFLRGWAYFELARLFGNIPMITAPLSSAEVKTVGQSPALDIINQVVIPDLKEALNLPFSEKLVDANGKAISLAKGRAHKMAANAMLARVYMTLAGYPFNEVSAKTEAKKYLTEVLSYAKNNNKYWAADINEWRKQWMPSEEYYNKYSIFAIQYRAGGTGNPSLFNFGPQLPASLTGRKIFGNQIYVEKSLMYEFEKTFADGNKDLRGDDYSILLGFQGEGSIQTYTNDKESVTVDGITKDVYSKTIIYKFMPSKPKIASLGLSLTPEASMIDDNDWPVNFPILRLEDMQLMYAELLIEEGKIAEAMGYVNDIRQRAGCDVVPTNVSAGEALNYIKRERRIELLGEGIRWFDQVRYGTWKTDTENMLDRYNNPTGTSKSYIKEGRYLYPIPLNQLNVTPGLYKQNEGYIE